MKKKKNIWKEIKKHRNAYLFISPFFILYAIFGLYPMLYSLVMSVYKYTPSKGFIEFVGLQNYINIFKDPVFYKALGNTLWFMLFNVPLLVFCAIGVAAIFNSPKIKGRQGFQVIYLLPYVTSSVAYGIVFSILFDERIGLINKVITSMGLPPVAWLTSPSFTKITINIILIWAWTGYNMLIMLGGLQNISRELYEAARIDGSTEWKSFLHITVPLMKPVILFATVTSTIGTFNMFNEPYIILGSNGGPEYSGLTLNMYLYSQTFSNFQLSYGAAISFVVFILILIFSIPQIKSSFKNVL